MAEAMRRVRATLFLAAIPVFSGTAQAQDFYAGKRMLFIVGYAAGSGYDINARFIARHIAGHIPGKPQIIVQNMPGAGTLNAANHVANIAPKDGTAIAFVARGMALEPLFGGKGVRFDPLKLNWIGSTSREVSVIAVRTDAGVNRIEDVRNKTIVVAGPAPGTDGVTYPNVLNNLLGTKFKVVTGYRSGKAMAMAVRRGEVQGRGSWSWASFKTEAMTELKEGKLKLLLQMGVAKAADLPNVPLVLDYARTDEQKKILDIVLAGQAMAWPSFMAEGVPQERVATIRKAWREALASPAAKAEAAKLGIDVDPVSGEAIEALLKRVYGAPKALVDKVKSMAGRM
ncbi:MAG: Bug family tripartite tricarboxylate transporter substrate binding protein [Beijerinckiaceae bacterium]